MLLVSNISYKLLVDNTYEYLEVEQVRVVYVGMLRQEMSTNALANNNDYTERRRHYSCTSNAHTAAVNR